MTALKLIDFSPLYCDVAYAERLMANAADAVLPETIEDTDDQADERTPAGDAR